MIGVGRLAKRTKERTIWKVPNCPVQEARMARLRPKDDVRPLSEFRANAASFVRQLKGTKRPVILTVHGRSAAVLLDVAEYETLLDQVELLQDVRTAEAELKSGRSVTHSRARERVMARLRK